MNSKGRIATVAIFVLFFLLFNSPFLNIPTGMIGNVPAIMIYIGMAWIILIVLMGMIFYKSKGDRG